MKPLDDEQTTARTWFEALRDQICAEFVAIEREAGSDAGFDYVAWDRTDPSGEPGGGGVRRVMKGKVFEKVGVNVSTVGGTFEGEFAKSIHGAADNPQFFATGISLVAHMANPHVPAVHMNCRFLVTTKRWFGGGADLNPPIPNDADTQDFHATLKAACDTHDPAHYPRFKQWADDYFYIPHRQVHRGVGGIFYDHLEGDFAANFAFTQDVGRAFLDVFPRIVRRRMAEQFTDADIAQRNAWRGRYVEFNLVYDRGTLFGLKTGGNIDAILMSLPPGGDMGVTPKLLRVLKGERLDVPPVWLVCQARQYLPEYRALRAEKGGFLDLATDPESAAEVTLQPIRRFGFDGAILFSDILMVPWALGQDLKFGAGEGPMLTPALVDATLDSLTRVAERLDPVYETVRRVAAALSPETTFLGFAGSPWTVATYMVAGHGSRDQGETRRFAYRDPAAFQHIVVAIADLTVDYLVRQIECGVQAVQLFDSWAGSLSPAQFEQWVIAPNARIIAALKQRHPDTPVIGFPKGAGGKLAAYANEMGADAIGLDETVDPLWANAILPAGVPVQGNLDPLALVTGGATLDVAIDRVLAAFPDRPHVFNLGHGILQDTPIAHVEQLLARVRR